MDPRTSHVVTAPKDDKSAATPADPRPEATSSPQRTPTRDRSPLGRRDDDDDVDVRAALLSAASALDLLQQCRQARALRRLRGSLEFFGRTSFRFFQDCGLSPRQVLPVVPTTLPPPLAVKSSSPGGPTSASATAGRPVRQENRRQRRDREWRERCAKRDAECAERRSGSVSTTGIDSEASTDVVDTETEVDTDVEKTPRPAAESPSRDRTATLKDEPKDAGMVVAVYMCMYSVPNHGRVHRGVCTCTCICGSPRKLGIVALALV